MCCTPSWRSTLQIINALCEWLDGEISQFEHRSSQQGIDHHAHTMSSDLGSNSGHQSPGTFRIVLRQVQLLLQLSIDRFADQAQAVELSLRLLGTYWQLVRLGRSEQLQ